MKATCIVGSARNNGSCARLIEALCKGLHAAGAKTAIYNIGECDVRYCTGCKQCEQTGFCVQNDDVHRIVSDMLASDLVVIAAPSYWAGIPAQLKTLFDRTTPYGDTNPNRHLIAEHPISGVAIAVRAGTRPQENQLILNSITHYFGHLGIKTAEELSFCGVNTPEDLLIRYPSALSEMQRLGYALAHK